MSVVDEYCEAQRPQKEAFMNQKIKPMVPIKHTMISIALDSVSRHFLSLLFSGKLVSPESSKRPKIITTPQARMGNMFVHSPTNPRYCSPVTSCMATRMRPMTYP